MLPQPVSMRNDDGGRGLCFDGIDFNLNYTVIGAIIKFNYIVKPDQTFERI